MTSKARRFVCCALAAALAALLSGCGEKQVPDEKLLKSGEYLAPPTGKSAKGGGEK